MKGMGEVWLFYNTETKIQTRPLSLVQAQITLQSLSGKNLESIYIWTPGWGDWISLIEYLKSNQNYFKINGKKISSEELANQDKNNNFLKDIIVKVSDQIPSRKEKTITNSSIREFTQTQTNLTSVEWGNEPIKQNKIDFSQADFNGENLTISQVKSAHLINKDKKRKKSSERRQNHRTDCKIEVILMGFHRTFRTYSKNISTSGTLLADEVPVDLLRGPVEIVFVNNLEVDPKKARLHFKAHIVGDLANPRRLNFMDQSLEMKQKLTAMLKSFEERYKQVKSEKNK